MPESPSSRRRPQRTTNQNSVNTTPPQAPTQWTFGGLTISVRALGVIVLVGIIGVILVPTGLQWADQQRQYKVVVAEVAAADERTAELRNQLNNWNDREYIADQARRRLGMSEKGETHFSVVDPGPSYAPKVGVEPVLPEGPAKPWMMVLVESLRAADNPEESK